MDFGKLMEQAQQMQQSIGQIEDQLNHTVYAGSSNGLKVEVNGKYECVSVSIPEDMMDDREMLQDILKIAFTQACEKAASDRESRMSSAAGGFKLPGM